MGTIWFCLVAMMIAMYVLLDGFDLGAGAIHLLVARTDAERRQVMARSGRCGTETKCGCWRRAGRCILRFRRYMRAGSADFIFR